MVRVSPRSPKETVYSCFTCVTEINLFKSVNEFTEKCYSESENLQTIGNILHDERNTNNDKLKTEWTTCKGQVSGAGCYNPGDDRG